jgi:hypothetical protein
MLKHCRRVFQHQEELNSWTEILIYESNNNNKKKESRESCMWVNMKILVNANQRLNQEIKK